MATIRFELRSDKIYKDGKSPIRVIYQIRGQRKFYPTSNKCFLANWDTESQKAICIDRKKAKKLAPGIMYDLLLSEKEAEAINSSLDGIKNDIDRVETRFRLDGITLTPKGVMDSLHTLR